jgi:hypothetical protein
VNHIAGYRSCFVCILLKEVQYKAVINFEYGSNVCKFYHSAITLKLQFNLELQFNRYLCHQEGGAIVHMLFVLVISSFHVVVNVEWLNFILTNAQIREIRRPPIYDDTRR